MGLHYRGGMGTIYDKELDKSIGTVDYQMIETDATKYTRKRWWGEFYSNRKIKRTGVYRLELEDGRSGDCVVWVKDDLITGKSTQFHYHFNGRGKLGKGYRR